MTPQASMKETLKELLEKLTALFNETVLEGTGMMQLVSSELGAMTRHPVLTLIGFTAVALAIYTAYRIFLRFDQHHDTTQHPPL